MNSRASSLYLPSHVLSNTPVPRFTGKLWKHPPNRPENGLSCCSGTGVTGRRTQVTGEPSRNAVTAMNNSVYSTLLRSNACCVSLAQKWLGGTKLSCSLQKKKGFGGLALAGSILSYLNGGWSYCWCREPIWENYLPVRVQALSSLHFSEISPWSGPL